MTLNHTVRQKPNLNILLLLSKVFTMIERSSEITRGTISSHERGCVKDDVLEDGVYKDFGINRTY